MKLFKIIRKRDFGIEKRQHPFLILLPVSNLLSIVKPVKFKQQITSQL